MQGGHKQVRPVKKGVIMSLQLPPLARHCRFSKRIDFPPTGATPTAEGLNATRVALAT